MGQGSGSLPKYESKYEQGWKKSRIRAEKIYESNPMNQGSGGQESLAPMSPRILPQAWLHQGVGWCKVPCLCYLYTNSNHSLVVLSKRINARLKKRLTYLSTSQETKFVPFWASLNPREQCAWWRDDHSPETRSTFSKIKNQQPICLSLIDSKYWVHLECPHHFLPEGYPQGFTYYSTNRSPLW